MNVAFAPIWCICVRAPGHAPRQARAGVHGGVRVGDQWEVAPSRNRIKF
jgi:hypothetical protein